MAAAPAAVAPTANGASRLNIGLVAGAVMLCSIGAFVAGRPADGPPAAAVAASPMGNAAATGRPAGASEPVRSVEMAPEAGVAAIDASRVALAAYNSGDVAGSVEQFMTAVEANPDNAEALNNLGQVLVRTGRASEAIPYFDRALQISGDTWSYHFNRARAFGEMQLWPRAIAGYRDAARLFPDDYATQFNLAKALQANGELAEAIETFERAIVLAPGQADFHLSLGLALEAAQRPKDAAAAYSRFLELEPSSPDAEKIQARISHLEAL